MTNRYQRVSALNAFFEGMAGATAVQLSACNTVGTAIVEGLTFQQAEALRGRITEHFNCLSTDSFVHMCDKADNSYEYSIPFNDFTE